MGRNRFFLTIGDASEAEVDRATFIVAERVAGFVPRVPLDVATAGFTHHSPGLDIEGRVEWDEDPAYDEEMV